MFLELSPQARDFGARFQQWLDQNLPAEWCHEPALSADDLAQMQLEWGQRLHAGGWAGPHWPREYGGLGLEMDELAVYIGALARHGAPEIQNNNPMSILGPAVIRFGTEEQKRTILPGILDHSRIWCQGFSEPGAGSDLASLATRARRVDDTFVISGQKLWTSRAMYAHACYMLVRTDPTAAKHDGISLVTVEMDQPGIEVRPITSITGSKSFAELFIDEAVAPVSGLVGPLHRGWEVARYALSMERWLTIAQRGSRIEGLLARLLRENPQLEKTARHDVTDLAGRCLALRTLVDRNFALGAADAELQYLASITKLFWSELEQDFFDFASSDAVAELETATPQADADWAAGAVASRAVTIYGGTSQIQRNMIARTALRTDFRRTLSGVAPLLPAEVADMRDAFGKSLGTAHRDLLCQPDGVEENSLREAASATRRAIVDGGWFDACAETGEESVEPPLVIAELLGAAAPGTAIAEQLGYFAGVATAGGPDLRSAFCEPDVSVAAAPSWTLHDSHLLAAGAQLNAVDTDSLSDTERAAGLAGAVTLRCASMVGGIEHLLDRAIDHAKSRSQFGAVIAEFQGVQHLIADIATSYDVARTALFGLALDGIPALDSEELEHLCSEVTREYYRSATKAIQVLGGMGFTWETGLHLYYRDAIDARTHFLVGVRRSAGR